MKTQWWAMPPFIYQDLELKQKCGIEYIHPELEWAMPLLDGKSLCISRDQARELRATLIRRTLNHFPEF